MIVWHATSPGGANAKCLIGRRKGSRHDAKAHVTHATTWFAVAELCVSFTRRDLPSLANEGRLGVPRIAARNPLNTMLYTIAVVMLILWLLGVVSSHAMGGFIHILLVVAIVLVLVRLIGGRRPV